MTNEAIDQNVIEELDSPCIIWPIYKSHINCSRLKSHQLDTTETTQSTENRIIHKFNNFELHNVTNYTNEFRQLMENVPPENQCIISLVKKNIVGDIAFTKCLISEEIPNTPVSHEIIQFTVGEAYNIENYTFENRRSVPGVEEGKQCVEAKILYIVELNDISFLTEFCTKSELIPIPHCF